MTNWSSVVVSVCLLGVSSQAQAAPWTFRWQKGQVLAYQVEHVTKVAEVLAGNKVEMSSKLKLLKRWHIDAVDSQGIATVRLTLASMRNEQTRPNGEVLLFDSEQPDKCTPELREQLAKFIGTTLAVLRVDSQGKVIETVQGSATQFECDLPFTVCLPTADASEGQAWQRSFQVVLDPPFGAGEKYAASQQYEVLKLSGNQATLRLNTVIKDMPKSAAEQMPLLQKQPQGEVVFDLAGGQVLSADLRIEREVQGHQGAGSSYRFESRHVEKLVE